MTTLVFALAAALGFLALPLGLLPSVFAFRALADGRDASARTKRFYAWTVWGGLALAWTLGAAIAYAILSAIL